MHVLAYIPSPTRSVWHLGPLPVRAYALCIVAGIVVALWLAGRRFTERGGTRDDVWDVSGWAIVLGIIGGRLYHVISDPELYFEGKPNTHPLNAFKIWDGGLGIWGAVALGTLGAWIGCRRKHISLKVFVDAAAPGVLIAQGIGRWGNYFNNELYGGPTGLPWKLQIHNIDVVTGQSQVDAAGHAVVLGYFQPTFLYESLWDIAIALVLLYLDRRFRLGRANVMALYVMGYTLGRVWIEALRTDHANHILGLRLNVWTSLLVFTGALIWFVRHGGMHAERESGPYTGPRAAASVSAEGPQAETALGDGGERSNEEGPGHESGDEVTVDADGRHDEQ